MQQSMQKPGLLAFYIVPVACVALALILKISGFQPHRAGSAATVLLGLVCVALVISTVFVALHHAEAIAHRVGQPYGTLILTFAVTSLEVSIIVSMMLNGENNPSSLPS